MSKKVTTKESTTGVTSLRERERLGTIRLTSAEARALVDDMRKKSLTDVESRDLLKSHVYEAMFLLRKAKRTQCVLVTRRGIAVREMAALRSLDITHPFHEAVCPRGYRVVTVAANESDEDCWVWYMRDVGGKPVLLNPRDVGLAVCG